ncbi:hypothetical protein [Citreimonas salinaria]|uniref:Type IV pilus biogenesis n=1 Tax=Citreimonas salinaria TaxID=321339 RepID=A0A1H3GBG6_9RHOB|nr:hypothetical protein [Citreimonas salinaria]SDX99988.1 hypothetical protein SAMN05444340_102235 [Citreimonas salinaria]
MLERSLRPFLRPDTLSRRAEYRSEPTVNDTVGRNATTQVEIDTKGPILLGLVGTEEALSALIRLPDGTIERVGAGDTLGERDTVVGIDSDGVVVTRGPFTNRLRLL